jgi:hypothetical protein
MRSKLNEFSMENAGQFIRVPVYQDAWLSQKVPNGLPFRYSKSASKYVWQIRVGSCRSSVTPNLQRALIEIHRFLKEWFKYKTQHLYNKQWRFVVVSIGEALQLRALWDNVITVVILCSYIRFFNSLLCTYTSQQCSAVIITSIQYHVWNFATLNRIIFLKEAMILVNNDVNCTVTKHYLILALYFSLLHFSIKIVLSNIFVSPIILDEQFSSVKYRH